MAFTAGTKKLTWAGDQWFSKRPVSGLSGRVRRQKKGDQDIQVGPNWALGPFTMGAAHHDGKPTQNSRRAGIVLDTPSRLDFRPLFSSVSNRPGRQPFLWANEAGPSSTIQFQTFATASFTASLI